MIIKVNNSQFQTSDLIESKIEEAQAADPYVEEIEIVVPLEYQPVLYLYLDFARKIYTNADGKVVLPTTLTPITDLNTLLLCFDMERFFRDETFLRYLMQQAYDMWDDFFPSIFGLPNKRLIYLYTPYEYLPYEYVNDINFIKQWIIINTDRRTDRQTDLTAYGRLELNGGETHLIDVKYYRDEPDQPMKLLTIHYDKERMVAYKTEKLWYENGEPWSLANYRNNQKHGLQQEWYDVSSASIAFSKVKSQAKYKRSYKNGKLDGVQESWYKNGQRSYRGNYKDGVEDGLQEEWFDNGQRKIRYTVKDGKKDGLFEQWYSNKQLLLRGRYIDNEKVGLWEEWNDDGTLDSSVVFQ